MSLDLSSGGIPGSAAAASRRSCANINHSIARELPISNVFRKTDYLAQIFTSWSLSRYALIGIISSPFRRSSRPAVLSARASPAFHKGPDVAVCTVRPVLRTGMEVGNFLRLTSFARKRTACLHVASTKNPLPNECSHRIGFRFALPDRGW